LRGSRARKVEEDCHVEFVVVEFVRPVSSGTRLTADPPAVADAPTPNQVPRTHSLFGRDWRLAWTFLAPLALIIIALIAYPFAYGIVLSFQQKLIGAPATWVGFSNYVDLLFGDQYGGVFRASVVASVVYTVVAILAKLVLGMCMALLLNERFRGRTVMRGLLFVPWALPTVIVALTWRWMYEGSDHGLFNLLLGDLFGIGPVQFLADPRLALWSVLLVVVWQGTPFYTMMFLAGMQAIPADQYEAASIDGANVFQRFYHVTLPWLRPAIVITTLLSTIWTANSINFIFILTGGGPADTTLTFPMLAYQIGIQSRELGMSSAVSVIFLPLFLVIIYVLTKRMLPADVKAGR